MHLSSDDEDDDEKLDGLSLGVEGLGKHPADVERLGHLSANGAKLQKTPMDVEKLQRVSTGDEEVSAGVERLGQLTADVRRPVRIRTEFEELGQHLEGPERFSGAVERLPRVSVGDEGLGCSVDVGKLVKTRMETGRLAQPWADVRNLVRIATAVEKLERVSENADKLG